MYKEERENMKYYLAIDIGASSGRHIIGWQEGGEIKTDEVYRFPNGVKEVDGHLVWDIDQLFKSVVAGMRRAFEKYPQIESVSIDTWGVDYVLLEGDKEIYPCYAYRDHRTEARIHEVHSLMSFESLYAHTGIQFQPFNTIYQLYDDLKKGRLESATDFLMIPEYLSYKLTGVKKKEYTNATTTGMLNADMGAFDEEILQKLGLPKCLFGEISEPKTTVGMLTEELQKEVGGNTKVVLCASHDTGSAVEGIPIEGNEPYISSGTWSLLGVKVPKAITDEGSQKANYSNEGGVGYVRYQKNIMGMWVVNELQKELCPEKHITEIVKEAQKSSFTRTVDVNANEFLAPESMKGAFDNALQGGEIPQTTADYFNCAFLSLAKSYKQAIEELEKNTDKKYTKLYIVGGGAKNGYLNALTENECKIEVVALPIEATAIGNLKIQMEKDDE